MVSASVDSTNLGSKVFLKCYIIADVYCEVRPTMIVFVLNMCRYFFLVIPQTKQYGNYLHGVYIVLGIISSLQMISSIWEDVCRLYANTTPFYIK